MDASKTNELASLAESIKSWSRELGFQQTGISDIDLSVAEQRLNKWLQDGYHGEMHYMEKHGAARSHPEKLVPGTLRVVSVRLDYLPENHQSISAILDSPEQAFVSRYALGRDYHKLIRNRLQKLADRIADKIGPFGYRVFTDSAPVLEKPLAEKAGLGWIGKHSNLINKESGSWFFLGEIYTDLPLPVDSAATDHCGTCHACIDCCPTGAIVAPYIVDARKCISYLTIELDGSIPQELRPMMGNRIYGCDDCQLYCPWNRFAKPTVEPDFMPREHLDSETLANLFCWTEAEFLQRTEGSAIRRIGFNRWLRNIAIALGNALAAGAGSRTTIVGALQTHLNHESEMVREHVNWAMQQQSIRQ
jgi:epoxyqueuosine reductase